MILPKKCIPGNACRIHEQIADDRDRFDRYHREYGGPEQLRVPPVPRYDQGMKKGNDENDGIDERDLEKKIGRQKQ